MNDQVEPADAVRALNEIGRRREQVIRRAIIPNWYWCANAVLAVAFTAAIESGRGVLVWVGLAGFVVGSIVIHVPVSRAARGAPPRRGIVGSASGRAALIGLATLMVVLVGVLLASVFSLKAAGVPYPGTIGVAITAVVYVVGWQLLIRYEVAGMVRRARSQG